MNKLSLIETADQYLLDEILRQIIKAHSAEIIAAKDPNLSGYELAGDTEFPDPKDFMYKRKSIIDSIMEIEDIDPQYKQTMVAASNYLVACYFNDDTTSDWQRNYVEQYLSLHVKWLGAFYRNSKFRWQNIMNLILFVHEQNAKMLFGFEIDKNEKVRKLSKRLLKVISAKGKVDGDAYRQPDFPLVKKKTAAVLATKLAKEICIACIKHYKVTKK